MGFPYTWYDGGLRAGGLVSPHHMATDWPAYFWYSDDSGGAPCVPPPIITLEDATPVPLMSPMLSAMPMSSPAVVPEPVPEPAPEPVLEQQAYLNVDDGEDVV